MDAGFADEPAAAGQLTEAELRLAALVRAGIVDAEIAVRLTTTVGQVRARIEALVARCGLASRAELKATDIALLAPRAAPATSHFISEAAAPGAAAPRAPPPSPASRRSRWPRGRSSRARGARPPARQPSRHRLRCHPGPFRPRGSRGSSR